MIGKKSGRRLLAIGCSVMVTVTGCAFQGVNSLPLPGAVGRGGDAAVYHVELANVGTLESNSPVLIDDVVVGSVGKMRLHGWHIDLDRSRSSRMPSCPPTPWPRSARPACWGRCTWRSDPPPGEAPSGRLKPGATIGLNSSSTYPSTEQTLSSLAAVVNGGGLGQIGDIVHNFNTALNGRQDVVRDLLARLDTFVGTLYQQRDNIIATIDELNRFASTLGGQQEVLTRALNKIPPALDVLIKERPRLTTALEKLGTLSDTVDRPRQRHAGRPGHQPAEPRTHPEGARRRRARDRYRSGVHPDVPADTEPDRPWRPRRLREPLRHRRFTNARIKRGLLLGTRSGRTARR